jgi:inner membrane protein
LASGFSHAIAALSIGTCFYRPGMPKRVGVAGAVCSVVPDLDVIGFRFGIHYGDFWGHRGFTDSFLFAALLATLVAILTFRKVSSETSLLCVWIYLFLATASHGFLDAMTDGGLGVAFFSPFNNDRYFLPWRPIRVSPIGVGRFFTERGLAVLQSELILDLASRGAARHSGLAVCAAALRQGRMIPCELIPANPPVFKRSRYFSLTKIHFYDSLLTE